ncbi:unnamed protein product [Arctia plantaginis]|uniref:Uncharacterized protein n=1 Tax=Arctia plantaginis TaxID=874455 RepID=A0A8S1ATN2_ARCPL|nr:unnamed protein product [Arctia plantaginis]
MEERLDIVLFNIRPFYTSQLALHPIDTWSELKQKCRLLESAKLRSDLFTEPPKNNSSCLAPDLSYKAFGRFGIVKFYIIPGVTTELLFGTNFWKEFNIAPDILSLLPDKEYFSSSEPVKTIATSERWLRDFDSLSEPERKQAEDVIRQFEEISADKKGLGLTHLVSHKIDTGDHSPIKQHYYPISPERLIELNKHLDQMLQDDVVEPSNSVWNNYVTLAPKSDESTENVHSATSSARGAIDAETPDLVGGSADAGGRTPARCVGVLPKRERNYQNAAYNGAYAGTSGMRN